jgi:outer membrane lipopolysaccharide assembly protein LptE/RlpB
MKRIAILCLLAACLLLNGCGYELVRDKGVFGGEVVALNVPIFKNRSYEPQVPGFFTDAFSRELAGSGLFDLNRPTADATLQGTINTVFSAPSSLSSQGLALEKVVSMSVSLVLFRQGNPTKSWAFADSEPYRVDDINLEDVNKRQAMQRIAARISRRFMAQLMGNY